MVRPAPRLWRRIRHRSISSFSRRRLENMAMPLSGGDIGAPVACYNISMEVSPDQYDPRYLAGIVLFNRGDFFEAHEAWEALWMETATPEKQFYQGLIQAAVGLCHFCNGNVRGAVKLYHSSKDYMVRYGSPFLGLD